MARGSRDKGSKRRSSTLGRALGLMAFMPLASRAPLYARLMLALSPVTNRVGFFIAGGPALLARGSNPLDDDRSKTDFGANVGAGLRFALNQSGSTALRLDVEDYLYNGDFGGGDDFQNDLVTSLGLSFSLGGGAE